MKKAGRKIAKDKLKSLEWSDKAIEDFCVTSVAQSAVKKNSENQHNVDSMESKIARVQERKKEAEERQQRNKAKATNSAPKREISIHKIHHGTNTDLANQLNEYFSNYIAENQVLVTNHLLNFPLFFFDSSLHDELMKVAVHWPAPGVCLFASTGPENSLVERGLGIWYPCTVVGIDEAGNYLVNNPDQSDDLVLSPMLVCLVAHDPKLYAERIIEAMDRRYKCISLLKYEAFYNSMPFNEKVTSTLTQSQNEHIYTRAASMKNLLNLTEVANRELDEAKTDFELVMNKILFEANLLSGTNSLFLKRLGLPSNIFDVPKPVPFSGLVSFVPHNMKNRVSHHKLNSYFCSVAAIRALQGILVENNGLNQVRIVTIEYTKTLSLEKFEHSMSEQLMRATRQIKQEWPQKSGASTRNAINKAQEFIKSVADHAGLFYDITLRNVYDFEQSKNPIKLFLERINFMMSDVLKHVVKESLLHFTDLIQQLCSCDVTVKDVRNIIVNFPADSIYKRKVLPPLFSVAFRIALEDKVLNPEEVEKNKREIANWNKTKEAENGEKCPIAPVAPIVGKTFEYSHSIDEFKNAILKVFHEIVHEFEDVPHIQKYVMDKIYFPHVKLIPSITPDLPWVVEAEEKVKKAMDTALAPLTSYLTFFKKYENFVNIDNAVHIASKIQVVVKDAESTEIELPVSVNLSQVIAVIDDHLNQIQEIEQSLPITPIDCGLFLVEVVSVRHLLLDKHRAIIKSILAAHSERCSTIAQYLEEEFKKISRKLAVKPENIEQLAELDEYVAGLTTTLGTLQNCIADMMSYHDLLDVYKFKTDFELGAQLWGVFGAPAKIALKCIDVTENNLSIKRKFRDEMQGEQATFTKTLHEMEKEVATLEELHDLNDVVNIAAKVKEVENKIIAAQAKVKLFNSRETLFEQDVTDYEELNRIQKSFEPYSNLWATAKDWIELSQQWYKGRFVDLNAEDIEKNVEKFTIAINKASKFFTKLDMKTQAAIASKIKAQVNEFSPEVPMIVTLRNPGMRDRHWEKIADQLHVDIMPIEDFTTEQIIKMNLKDSLELIQKIGESAAKEYQIEQALVKMEKEWENMMLSIHPYRETGTGVLKGIDDINTILDEQITMTQTIMFSAFKGPFEARIDEWNRKLCCVSDVLEVWVTVQRNWLYLQPIFESADINRQLPAEGKKFSTVDKSWRQTISAAKAKPKVIEFCDNAKLLERFKESEILLDQVQKGLSDYLETKRAVFARFYFLSNDELLSILSESKDVKLVQPHLKKCFEGIDKVKFLPDLQIDRFISPENEEIMCNTKINPVDKNVEVWMLELEAMMRESIREVMGRAIASYTAVPRAKWMQQWPGMCVLNGSQLHWTREMEELFLKEGSKGPTTMYNRQVAQLADMTVLVRGKLSSSARTTVGALTVIDVHARDVIKKLVDDEVETKDNFSWTSQLRYYWDGELSAQMVASTRPYGYEYLGNTFRLVITPLTDKCYLTLMGALQMIFGGAPAGPAGTGKTETTKDLAKALAMQCVVFNCSDGLDYIAMGKFFKGLAACGAWACFDEFNRINIEVLSVIGQQIMSIQMVIRAKESRMTFEGSDIFVSERFAVFITMNPGYAGRSALPDSLQALFRPVAMMVPDYALIGEIMFFAYGFEYAKECGAKMVTTFKLCSEQLSSQPHYDYGMRAVKTVITAAGNLKRAEPDADEMVLLLRALQDVNIPKFLEMDLPLFEGIISDLFPGKKRPDLDYGALMRTMKEEICNFGLQPIKFFITKVIQLYEMIIVRHGLMLVGPTGGGKSRNLHVLEETLGSLKNQGISGFAYEKVRIYQLNPKSITMGQMYGEFDPNTMEWRDGIMSTMYRGATVDTPDRKWIVFDGPVDAIWIENMNTVLDDNKKLCLNSGEMLKMSNEMTMMFEVEDLVVASPATVSRVGIIYMEPKGLGLDVLMQSWLDRMPPCTPVVVKSKLTYYFDLYMQPSINFLRTHLKELVPTVDNNLAESLMRILDCFLEPYEIVEGRAPPTDLMIADLVTCIEPLFIFALVWSIGATTNEDGRRMFDSFLRQELYCNKFSWPIPKGGMVYDYLFLMDTKKWVKWMDVIEKYEIDPKLSFAEIIVPTTDSVRSTFLLDLLLTCDKHTLMVGATGTGKTVNINQYLMGAMKVQGKLIRPNVIPITLTFSANTGANMTQDLLDSKMDKRRKGVYGPAAGKRFFIYVDDLNMPKREEYGAQPPIEILRQWFDQNGWYDRKDLSFRKLVDLTFVASMGPPGGGRQEITPRFLRHFNIIGYVEMSDASKAIIFGTILRAFLTPFDGGIVTMTDDIVNSSIEIFSTIVRDLLPTPSKSHYTFNLRDLAKVFQGMLMVDSKRINTKLQLARLWVHENLRVFADRLTCEEDHLWLDELMKKKVEGVFGMVWNEVVPRERLIYGDFMNGDAKIYDEITSMDNLKAVIEEYLVNHNMESKQPMPLVMFSDALEHVARIARVLRQPQGNALLLGVGGSGRQSMTKLATYVAGFSLAMVEIVKGYSMNDWRDDIKRILMQAGVKDKPTTFLFSDVQVCIHNLILSSDHVYTDYQ